VQKVACACPHMYHYG